MLVSLAVDKRNFVLLSFTARPILRTSSAYLEKAASPEAYASNRADNFLHKDVEEIAG